MGIWTDPKKVSNTAEGYSAAQGAVEARFLLAEEYADEAKAWTYDYANALSAVLTSLEVPVPPDIEVESVDVPPINYSERPEFGDVVIDEEWPETLPTKPTLTDVGTIPSVQLPAYSFQPPNLEQIDRPIIDDVPDPGAPPDPSDLTLPTKPDFALPDPPVLSDLNFPSPPEIAIPEFTATFVEESFDIPPGFSWQSSAYNSPLWNQLLTNVLDGLINGGTGLGADVEADIWMNAGSRIDIEIDKKLQEVEEYFAAKGHLLPPGSLAAAYLEINKEGTRLKADLNRDISIEQAKLAKEHTQFITDKGLSLEQILRDFHNNQENRILEAARATVSAAVDIYNARIARYNVKLEQYKVAAQVYESEVKAALMNLEIYKSQIEAVKVSSDVQKNLVDIYSEQIRAVETMAKLYSAELEGSRLYMEMERLRLDAFKSNTEIYVARLDAQKTKADIYGKELEGERTKASIYTEQLRGYTAQVEAIGKEADINIAIVSAKNDTNRQLIAQYTAELEAYKTQVDAVASKIGAQVDGFRAEVAGYSAETEAQGMYYRTQMAVIEANIKNAELQMNKAIAEIEAATNGYVAIKELQVKGTEGLVNVGAQLTASAWTSVNANASLGASVSNSNSDSYVGSESLSEAHNYDHEG